MYIFRFIIVIDWCQICLFIVFTSHKTNSLLPDYLLSIIVLLCGKPAIRNANIRRISSQYLMDFRRMTGKENILCVIILELSDGYPKYFCQISAVRTAGFDPMLCHDDDLSRPDGQIAKMLKYLGD